MGGAKKKDIGTRLKAWGALLVILYFIATIIVVASDNTRAGVIMGAGSLALIGVLICGSIISRRREEKKTQRYGRNTVLMTITSVVLPEDADRLARAAKLLTGADPAVSEMTGAGLLGYLKERKTVTDLDKSCGLPDLINGLNEALAAMPGGPGPVLSGDMITALDTPYTANRRADGVDTCQSDINTAAYLLREANIEPVRLFALRPEYAGGEKPSGGHVMRCDTDRLNIAPVPMDRMHELYDILAAPENN